MVAETQQLAEAASHAGPLGTLGIEGKLFLAQLVNFGVVALVMWKWVYTPLLRIMDERTAKISQGLKDADASGIARKAAEEAAATVITEARVKAKQIMDDAVKAADAERAASTDKAKAEVARVVAQGKADLVTEKAKLMNEVKSEVGTLVAMATERVLGEKADSQNDAAMISRALKDLSKAA